MDRDAAPSNPRKSPTEGSRISEEPVQSSHSANREGAAILDLRPVPRTTALMICTQRGPVCDQLRPAELYRPLFLWACLYYSECASRRSVGKRWIGDQSVFFPGSPRVRVQLAASVTQQRWRIVLQHVVYAATVQHPCEPDQLGSTLFRFGQLRSVRHLGYYSASRRPSRWNIFQLHEYFPLTCPPTRAGSVIYDRLSRGGGKSTPRQQDDGSFIAAHETLLAEEHGIRGAR